MKTQRLGDSDLYISSLGIGTYALGGAGWKFAWGPQDDGDSIATIRRAIDAGINWVDTAAVYGYGHAEEVVARALDGMRERPYVFTKCSLVWDEQGQITAVLKRDSLRRELEASLRRLRVETIDLYQIHWPRVPPDIEEAWEALSAFKREGKVRYIGLSNFDVPYMERARKVATITSLQPPYSIINRSIEPEILPYAREHGIGVIAYAPMQNGLLSGRMTHERVTALPANDWRRGNVEFQEPRLTRNLRIADALAKIARDMTSGGQPLTVPEVAIAWVLRQRGVTGVIVGARQPTHVEDFGRAAEVDLDARALAAIEEASSLPT
jgi:aryl-alcohol dehydrogenase-like predicted oxidoreductase